MRARGQAVAQRAPPAPVEAVTKETAATGGSAEAAEAEVDALHEQAVDQHLQPVTTRRAGSTAPANAIGLPHPKLRVPLVELDAEGFSLPDRDLPQVVPSDRPAGRPAHGRQPIGVIMTVTAIPSRTGTPLVGGRRGPAMAAVEALTRDLSAELAPQGIRLVGLRSPGIPEPGRITEAFETRAQASGMTWEQFQESLAPRTHTRRRWTLAELAHLAVFMASEKASRMTGTTLNPTMGSPDD